MKKIAGKNWYYWLVLIVVLVLARLIGNYVGKTTGILNDNGESANPSWVTYNINGLSIQTPFNLEKEDTISLPSYLSKMIIDSSEYTGSDPLFATIAITYLAFNYASDSFSLQGAVQGEVSSFKSAIGITDFNYQSSDYKKPNFPRAEIIKATAKYNNIPTSITSLVVYTKNKKSYAVVIICYDLKKASQDKVDKIINSISFSSL
jgi:hypothetical protein